MNASKRWVIATAVAILGFPAVSPSSVEAQHPVEGIEWMISNLRDTGQPVIPIFEGWFVNPDESHTLCFGYFNMNFVEEIDIPLGPDNFFEPAEFDGAQPTHFMHFPPGPSSHRRYFCTHTVQLPPDFPRDQRVWWTLVQDGREYRVPGHLSRPDYNIHEGYQFNQGSDSWAPVITFVEPVDGPSGIGRGIETLSAGPVTVRLGEELPLVIRVEPPEGGVGASGQAYLDDDDGFAPDEPAEVTDEEPMDYWVVWGKHSGPSDAPVTFESWRIEVKGSDPYARTTATFSEAGEYVLRVQATDDPREGGSFQFQCCWTNGYLRVNVTP